MDRYLLLRKRARFWHQHGWMSPPDLAFLRGAYRKILFGGA